MEFEEEIGIALGQKVKHKKFGEGIVLNYEGSGDSQEFKLILMNREQSGWSWHTQILKNYNEEIFNTFYHFRYYQLHKRNHRFRNCFYRQR